MNKRFIALLLSCFVTCANAMQSNAEQPQASGCQIFSAASVNDLPGRVVPMRRIQRLQPSGHNTFFFKDFHGHSLPQFPFPPNEARRQAKKYAVLHARAVAARKQQGAKNSREQLAAQVAALVAVGIKIRREDDAAEGLLKFSRG